MDLSNTIVAIVHDRVGGVLAALLQNKTLEKDLADGKGPFYITPTQTLIGQLESPAVTLPLVSAGFLGDIALSSLSALVTKLRAITGVVGPEAPAGAAALPNPRDVLAQLRDALKGQLPFLPQQAGANQPGVIEALVGLLDRDHPGTANPAKALQDSVDTLLKGLRGAGPAADDSTVNRLKKMLGNDIGTLMPLATIANAMKDVQNAAHVPKSIEQGILAYLFSAQGYTTVDGESVIAPVHLSDLKNLAAGALDVSAAGGVGVDPASVKQLKGLFTTATAERYLRDTIRVVVESSYDALRGFGTADSPAGRFGTVTTALGKRKKPGVDPNIVDKFVTWFRGFSSMAESATMRAVEVGTQGVSEFQTNPLIAAAAGTFAGTVARKLAQDTFLAVLSAELDQHPPSPNAGKGA
jgi:hypothetical protein